ELEPQQYGGGQERGLRPGTLNVSAIVGLGTAADLCLKNMTEESARLGGLRDKFIARVLAGVSCARLNGHPRERLVSNISFSFDGLAADVFALGLPDVAASSGSACSQ